MNNYTGIIKKFQPFLQFFDSSFDGAYFGFATGPYGNFLILNKKMKL